MSKLPDYHLKTEFRIEHPSGRSTGFRIRYRSPDTANKWTKLSLPEITKANKLLNDKTSPVSLEHTFEKLKPILAAQYVHRDRKKKKAAFMSENLKLVEAMWKDKYNRRRLRSLKQPGDSKYELMKAAEACGMFPLDTCDLEELADYLDANLGKFHNRLARRILWINSILQWLGRNKLQAVKRKQGKVCYFNEDEFKLVCDEIRDNDQLLLLMRIAFYTGARLGEIFYIQERHIRGDTCLLELQMLTDLEPDGTFKEGTLKNGLSRDVFIVGKVKEDLLEWARTPFHARYVIRKDSFSRMVYKVCVSAFGEADPIKLLNFHDLRHCCAIWLLQAGATITEVAQQLGNSPDVCYRYYSGFELKKESVERLKRLVG